MDAKLAARQTFLGKVLSKEPASGAAGVAQELFSSRVPYHQQGRLSRVNILDSIREGIFGSPVDLAREFLRYGKSPNGFDLKKAIGKTYYRSVIPRRLPDATFSGRALRGATMAMNVAFPALELYGAATAPSEYRNESIGRAAASVLASPFTARLGIPGQYLERGITDVGGYIGRQFNKPKNEITKPSVEST